MSLLLEFKSAARLGLLGRRSAGQRLTRLSPGLVLGKGGLTLVGAGRPLACPAPERRFAGRLGVPLATFWVSVKTFGAGAQGFAESRILMQAAGALTHGVALLCLTDIFAARDEVDALGLGDAAGASLVDAESKADALGVSLVAQGRDDLRIELRRRGAGQ
jgi:hypothetical protein